MSLKGKNIVLGITGSIAAYKAAYIIRSLSSEGADVQVLMTAFAHEFITPGTLSTLSGRPVMTDFFVRDTGEWNSHVELGEWADLLLIAPATANTIGKMAGGITDNLLLATFLASTAPVYIAPAMDATMYAHPSTQENITTLRSYGVSIIEPVSGDLASGLQGKGRMEDPLNIVSQIAVVFQDQTTSSQQEAPKKKLKGKKCLVTAGPTYEPIDPVRYLGNVSSGKMGFAIANTLAGYGAEVELVTGPVNMETDHARIHRHNVQSAREMYDTVLNYSSEADVMVLCAAVSDYQPEIYHSSKIKKGADKWSLPLKPTIDIAAELGARKSKDQVMVGFALESSDELQNARQKKKSKNMDMIVLNAVDQKEGGGIQGDTNQISVIDQQNNIEHYQLKYKEDVARDIVSKICDII